MRKISKKKVLKSVAKAGLSIVYFSLLIAPAPASAIDTSSQIIGSDAAKGAVNGAFKLVRSKPVLVLAAVISCSACVPTVGVAASASMCVACGILIAKTVG